MQRVVQVGVQLVRVVDVRAQTDEAQAHERRDERVVSRVARQVHLGNGPHAIEAPGRERPAQFVEHGLSRRDLHLHSNTLAPVRCEGAGVLVELSPTSDWDEYEYLRIKSSRGPAPFPLFRYFFSLSYAKAAPRGHGSVNASTWTARSQSDCSTCLSPLGMALHNFPRCTRPTTACALPAQ